MRQIRLNAFDMACVGHIQHGMWTHKRDRSSDYLSLDHWVSLALLLEKGLFDGLFLADILGVYDVFEDSPAPSLRNAVQIPLIDPMALVPAMAHATTHLGFGVTCNLAYEPPFLFARRMATQRAPVSIGHFGGLVLQPQQQLRFKPHLRFGR